MRPEERFQKILDVLEKEGFVTVKSLSKRFFISMPTVYRDLRELEYQGLVVRGNGGAMRVSEEIANMPLSFRQSLQTEEKSRIARRATKLVRPGSVLFLDASTTAACMADYLEPALNVTVLTNGLMTAVHLRDAGIQTYCVGGHLIGNSVAVAGKLADDMVDRFPIDMMFFSSVGVDPRGNIVDSSEPESCLRRHLLRKPITSVFLCDQSKFGKHSVFRVASLETIDYVVSDAPLPSEYPRPRRESIVV